MEQITKRIKIDIPDTLSLPFDIWNLIFRLLHSKDLKQFALTSKTCRFVLGQSLLKLDLSDYRPTHETNIDDPDSNDPFPPTFVERIISGFPNLTVINLSFTLVDDRGLPLLSKLTKLRRLSLSKCLFITTEGIANLIKSLTDLTHLDISYNHQLDGTVIFNAIEESPSSKSLIKLNVNSLLTIKAKSFFNIKKLIANGTFFENILELVKSSKLEYLQLKWIPRFSTAELKPLCDELKIKLVTSNTEYPAELNIIDDTQYTEQYMSTLFEEEAELGPLNYYESLYSLKLLNNKVLRPSGVCEETFDYDNDVIVDIAKAQAYVLLYNSTFYDYFDECLDKGPLVVAESLKALGSIGKANLASNEEMLPKIFNLIKEKLDFVKSSSRPERTWELIENATLALATCIKGKSAEDIEEDLNANLDVFVPLLDHERPAIKLAAMAVLTEISDIGGEPLNEIINRGVVTKACSLLSCDDPKTLLSALNIMGCISTGDDTQTQSVINSGACSLMVKLLKHPDVQVSKRACWALSNITAGSSAQIHEVMICGAFPIFAEMLANGHEEEKREAAWALVNAMMPQNKEQLDKLAEVGSLDLLIKYVLNVPNLAPALYSAIVRAFRNFSTADVKYGLLLKGKLTDEVLAILMSNTDWAVYRTLNDAMNRPELDS